MIKIQLKKISSKDEKFRDMKKEIIETYVSSGKVLVDEATVMECSEMVYHNGAAILLDIDEAKLDDIVFGGDEKYKNKYQREADLASYYADLFKDFPQKLVYDQNVWTYLNMTVFRKYVVELYLPDNITNPEDRIRRYLFNETSHSKLDRTGMRFLWYFGMKLGLNDNTERAMVAMEFIDPVKAIFERKMACNDIVIKAFVDAIIKGGKNSALKNNDMRKDVPHHIQCYAGVINIDAFDYDELVDIFVVEQNRILAKSNEQMV